MSSYRRAKREDPKTSIQYPNINLGSYRDNYEELQRLCYDRCVELLKTIEIPEGEIVEIGFWTADFPELIGIATFSKNNGGLPIFSWDDSQSTL